MQPGLQLGQLIFDPAGSFQIGEFIAQGLLAADVVGIDLAFKFVQVALDLLEPAEGVGDAVVIQL